MYARVITSQVKPGQLQALTRLYQDEIVPVIEQQPGFNRLLVLRHAETNEEISISLWETEAEMNAFSRHYLPPLMQKFTPLLAAAPKIEIHFLCCQAEAHPVLQHVQLGETSLGLHIEDPLDINPPLIEAIPGATFKRAVVHSH